MPILFFVDYFSLDHINIWNLIGLETSLVWKPLQNDLTPRHQSQVSLGTPMGHSHLPAVIAGFFGSFHWARSISMFEVGVMIVTSLHVLKRVPIKCLKLGS